jgi:sigma-B regulation protein RsbU (phosphoserine phosphatase)
MTDWPGAPKLEIDAGAESARLDELRTLGLIDTPPEYRFDRITRLAADFFHVPIAYIAFIDENRQWMKSQIGIASLETPRCMTFCQYTIQHDKPLVMPNTLEHPIGEGHPWVTGEPFVRFYAGVPLSGPTGKKIGTLCLVDFAAREFGEKEVASLVTFGSLVEREINLGEIIQTQHQLLQIRRRLLQTQHDLEHEFADAAKYVRRMLPPPLDDHEIVNWAYDPSTRLGGDGLGYRRIDEDRLGIYVLDVTGHGLGSALLAVTAMELLRNPVAQVDFIRPATVLDRLNRTFPMNDHAGKFFSVWYGVYSRSRRELTYANGGHPPALVYTHRDGHPELQQTEPGTSVLGVLPEIPFPEFTIPFPPGTELLLFSDGLYELTDPAGGRGSYDEFVARMRKEVATGTRPWDFLRHWHNAAREKNVIDDDVTMMRFATRV